VGKACSIELSKSAIVGLLDDHLITAYKAGMLLCVTAASMSVLIHACTQIVKDKRTKKTKGFGFVSFMDSLDFAKALKEMNGKYIGNRPAKLRKSTWDERNAHFGNNKK